MRQTSSGLGILKVLLAVVAVAVLLAVAFWVVIILIGAAIVFALGRAVVRAFARPQTPEGETIIIEPGHRVNYDNGNVIVLPVEGSAR